MIERIVRGGVNGTVVGWRDGETALVVWDGRQTTPDEVTVRWEHLGHVILMTESGRFLALDSGQVFDELRQARAHVNRVERDRVTNQAWL